jgi:predicted signal transduction protein with EAL and GGDEF domain
LNAYVQPPTEAFVAQTQVFRRSGDEFFVLQLLPPNSTVDDFLESLLQEVRATKVTLNNEQVSFTVSIGYAQLTPDESSEEFETHVEQAVKLAKKNGRNRAERYSSETDAAVDTIDYRKDCSTCKSFFSVSIPREKADLSVLQCPVCQSELAL